VCSRLTLLRQSVNK